MIASSSSNLFLQFFKCMHIFYHLVLNIFHLDLFSLESLCLTYISRFKKLEILDLNENWLTRTISLSFINLSSLNLLNLGGNMLNGTFDVQSNNLKTPMQLFFCYETINSLSIMAYIILLVYVSLSFIQLVSLIF